MDDPSHISTDSLGLYLLLNLSANFLTMVRENVKRYDAQITGKNISESKRGKWHFFIIPQHSNHLQHNFLTGSYYHTLRQRKISHPSQ